MRISSAATLESTPPLMAINAFCAMVFLSGSAQLDHAVDTPSGLFNGIRFQQDLVAPPAGHGVVHIHQRSQLHVGADQIFRQQIEPLVGAAVGQVLGNADLRADDEERKKTEMDAAVSPFSVTANTEEQSEEQSVPITKKDLELI